MTAIHTPVYVVQDMLNDRIKVFFSHSEAEAFAKKCRENLPGYHIPVEIILASGQEVTGMCYEY